MHTSTDMGVGTIREAGFMRGRHVAHVPDCASKGPRHYTKEQKHLDLYGLIYIVIRECPPTAGTLLFRYHQLMTVE